MDMPYQSLTIRTSSPGKVGNARVYTQLPSFWNDLSRKQPGHTQSSSRYDGTMGAGLQAGLERAYLRLQLHGKIDGVCYEAFRVSGVMQCARLGDIGARHNLYLRTQ